MALDQTQNFPPQPGCQSKATDTSYFCGLCPREYDYEDLLRKHVVTHSNEKRILCPCGLHLEGLDIYGYDRPRCTTYTLEGLLELVRHSRRKATRIAPSPGSENGREGDKLPRRSTRLSRLAATSFHGLLMPASPPEMGEVAQGGARPARDAREGLTINVSNGTRDSSSMTTQPEQPARLDACSPGADSSRSLAGDIQSLTPATVGGIAFRGARERDFHRRGAKRRKTQEAEKAKEAAKKLENEIRVRKVQQQKLTGHIKMLKRLREEGEGQLKSMEKELHERRKETMSA